MKRVQMKLHCKTGLTSLNKPFFGQNRHPMQFESWDMNREIIKNIPIIRGTMHAIDSINFAYYRG